MTLMKRLSLTLLALVAFGATGVATAQTNDAPKLADKPFLGRVSGGAAVRYHLTRTSNAQTVTIGGHKATVKSTDKATREYTAFVSAPGFVAGRSYSFSITAISRSGKYKLTYRTMLYMHRSLNQPQSG